MMEHSESNMQHDNAESRARELEKKQISILRSGNIKATLETIREIRESGSIAILPEVFEVLLDSEDNDIQTACKGLLNDLKSEEGAELISAALKADKYRPIRSSLVAACWQNGLSYHNDILLFAEILLKDDYATGIEAFTVIENSLGSLSDQQILKLIEKLSSGLVSVDEEKKVLVNEMISVIKSF